MDTLELALQRADDKNVDFQAILRDDYGSKERELALKESEEKFRGLFEKASVTSFVAYVVKRKAISDG